MPSAPNEIAAPAQPRAAHLIATGTGAGWLCGLWIGVLTLRLNDVFAGAAIDAVQLCALLGVLYAAGGAAWGTAVWAAARVGSALLPRPWLNAAAATVAGGLPLVAALLLPDTGLFRSLLTTVLALRPWPKVAVAALAACLALAVAGALLHRRLAQTSFAGWRRALLLASAVLLAWGAAHALTATGAAEISSPEAVTREADRHPVVVVCIDGADPDDVLQPMIARGELPTFAKLAQEGVFAPLETIAPTLSPAVWTTMATGLPPREHGIFHFVFFDLPFVDRPVSVFPLHTGLNFKIFPWLETLPLPLARQAPFTSELRRAPAVWNIVGDHAPVGMFRWRVTWPAENVNGFAVAADVSLLDRMPGFASESADALEERRYHPSDAFRDLPRPETGETTPADVAPYLGKDVTPDQVDLDDPELRQVVRSLDRISTQRIAGLIGKYAPVTTLIGFHSVDGFSHLYWRPRRTGGRFETAIDARYRFVDEQLGILVDALQESLGAFNLLVVSDHGFDFRRGHHTHAPPGIFLGWGPAFSSSGDTPQLSVTDLTPMVLDLSGLPVARDMPAVGDATGEPRYRAALSAAYRGRHPVRFTSTYGRTDPRGAASAPPDEEETLRKLKSLGYLE